MDNPQHPYSPATVNSERAAHFCAVHGLTHAPVEKKYRKFCGICGLACSLVELVDVMTLPEEQRQPERARRIQGFVATDTEIVDSLHDILEGSRECVGLTAHKAVFIVAAQQKRAQAIEQGLKIEAEKQRIRRGNRGNGRRRK